MLPRRRRSDRAPAPLVAFLRRRTACYLPRLEPKARALVRLLPALLTARFRSPGLDRESPGLALLPRRRRWARLCQAIDLPLPQTWSFPRPLVQSAVLVPRDERTFELLFLAVDDVLPHERGRVVDRIEGLRALAARVAPELDLRLVDPGQLTPAMLAWAALPAGQLPPLIDLPVDPLDLASRAPTPLARALALLVSPDAKHPIEAAHANPVLQVSSPERFVARWSRSAVAESVAAVASEALPEISAVVEWGHALQAEVRRARRRLSPAARRALGPLLRSELFSSPVPMALREPFERALKGKKVVERSEDERWSIAVDGVDVVTAPTLDQARARAYSISPQLVARSPEWRRVAGFASASGQRRALVVVEPRDMDCLVIALGRSGRATVARCDPPQLIRKVLWLRSRGDAIELFLQPHADTQLATRLGQVAALPQDGTPLGVQVGDRLVVARAEERRARRLASYLAWPRRLRWLPEQADWGAALRSPKRSAVPSVQATVLPLTEETAVVLYVDDAGRVLREELDLIHLEDALREARGLLRDGPTPAALSVSVHSRLAALGGRRPGADLPVVLFDVEWTRPGEVRLRLGDDAFCGRGDPPWSAAVETIFSHWPPGTLGRVGVRALRFVRPSAKVSPLHTLAVRSYVLRRLAGGIRRLSWLLDAA